MLIYQNFFFFFCLFSFFKKKLVDCWDGPNGQAKATHGGTL